MIASIWWDLTRASANVAWVLVLTTILWGVLLTTRVLRGLDRPAWLLDLHKWMGGLTIVFTIVHMLSLIADSYVQFTFLSVLVPFTSDYRSWAVSLGVFGFWLLVIIQVTSLMKKHLSQKVWRGIHMTSYPLYAIIVVHALTAGSDVGTPLYAGFSTALAMTGAAVAGMRWVVGRSASRKSRTLGV